MTIPCPRRTERPPMEVYDPVRRLPAALPDELDFHLDLHGVDRLAPLALRQLRNLSLLVRSGDTVATMSARLGCCPMALQAMLLSRGYGLVLDQLRANERAQGGWGR